jgi:hypothetical protein
MFSFLLVLACAVDNSLTTKDDAEGGFDSGDPVVPPFTEPVLVADPVAVGLGTVCGQVEQVVTLTNMGDAELIVRGIEVDGSGWTVEEVALPLTLAAGASRPLRLEGTGGSAFLVVTSNDPGNERMEISLDAQPDLAPSVVITSPVPSATVPSGTSTFTATVADDLDAPGDLSLRWISDIDGVVGSDPALGDGSALLAWSSDARSPGPHVLVLEATDSCGNVATTEVTLCQQAGYVAESLDLATWNFEGSARWDAANGWVELTAPVGNVAGTAFQTASTVSADNVNVSFSFYVSGGSGADGISVTALDVARMTGFVGETGGGIGYIGMPGWTVEVDTWHNPENNDPTPEDHVSVHVDGNARNVLAWATLPEMEDNAWHTMDLSVVGSQVTVRIDGTLAIDQSVPEITPFSAYVGFTAATGGATNYHLIDALEVTEYVCPE